MRSMYDDPTLRYMEMIQGAITRMGTNSFSLKGWTVTLVAAIVTLANSYGSIALVVVIVFWFLDTYYLQLARKYRALYDYIRKSDDSPIDFELNPKKFIERISDRQHLTFWRCLLSKTELWFYVPIAVIVRLLLVGII